MGQQTEGGAPTNLTDDGAVSLVPGVLLGFYVNSTNAGTVIVRDGGAAGTAITGTITPAIGFHRMGAACSVGCFLEIGGTALDVSVLYGTGT